MSGATEAKPADYFFTVDVIMQTCLGGGGISRPLYSARNFRSL